MLGIYVFKQLIAFSGVLCCYSWRRGVLSRISERLTCEHNPNGPKTSFTALPGFGSPPALCAASRRALEGIPRRLYTWETTCQLLLLNDAAGWRRVYPCVRTDYKIRAKKQQQAPVIPAAYASAAPSQRSFLSTDASRCLDKTWKIQEASIPCHIQHVCLINDQECMSYAGPGRVRPARPVRCLAAACDTHTVENLRAMINV